MPGRHKYSDGSVFPSHNLSCRKYALKLYRGVHGFNKDLIGRLARLRGIIDRARFTDEESSHIGLINLSRRLWLIYGERGSIHIVSDHDKGFTVSIEIEGVEIGPSDS